MEMNLKSRPTDIIEFNFSKNIRFDENNKELIEKLFYSS